MLVRFFSLLTLAAGFVAVEILLAFAGTNQLAVPAEFYRAGFVTYMRYTSMSGILPTHSVAWLDFDNNRSRSWNVSTTVVWNYPIICTAIESSGEFYSCLPGGFRRPVGVETVSVPLRRGSRAGPFLLRGEPQRAAATHGGGPTAKYRWLASPIDSGAASDSRNQCYGRASPKYYYEYQADIEGDPVSETLGETCGNEDIVIDRIVYQDIEFVDPATLPSYLFDPVATQSGLIQDLFSTLRERYERVYWPGLSVGKYELAGVGPCEGKTGCIELDYQTAESSSVMKAADRSSDLILHMGESDRECSTGTMADSPFPGTLLCSEPIRNTGGVYLVASTVSPEGLVINLWADSSKIGRGDMLDLLSSLRVYAGPVPNDRPPLLTEEDVRSLVTDALEFVCPDEMGAIRQNADKAQFSYDSALQEWRGAFGPFGDYAVPDLEPVVIPLASLAEIEAGVRGTYAPDYAPCVRWGP